MSSNNSLLTETYKMSDLRTKYANFMIPDARILAGGKQIKRSNDKVSILIDNIKLKFSTDAAGSLTFDVLNAYDLTGRCFYSDVKEKLKVGKVITAEIGYAGNLTQIFKGYIHSVSFEYSDTPVLSVTALDVIHLMQENEVLKKTHQDKNPTEVFEEIMKQYVKVCPANSVTADPSTSPKEDIVQKGSDYSFIKEVLCPMECRDFYVLNGEAYFVDPGKKKSSVLALEWGVDILSFSCERNYLNKLIKVNAVDKINKTEQILVEAKVTGTLQDEVISSPLVKNISMEAETTIKEAELQVKKAVDEEKQKSISCSGSCIGIPQIVPGRSLTISKLDQHIDGTYEILSVEHNIGSDGYVTNFKLGGVS